MTRKKVDLPFGDYDDLPAPVPSALPAEIVVRVGKGVLPMGRTGTRHGFHSPEAVEIPTSLSCNLCPLYHVKRKDRRHPLACREGRKNRICPILRDRQVRWVGELLNEVKGVTGEGPTASDRLRIEQIVRHRSRVWQVENYLKVAGMIDLKAGQVRNVAERLNTVENALARSLGEFRLALADRRQVKPTAPTLSEYLEVKAQEDGSGEDD